MWGFELLKSPNNWQNFVLSLTLCYLVMFKFGSRAGRSSVSIPIELYRKARRSLLGGDWEFSLPPRRIIPAGKICFLSLKCPVRNPVLELSQFVENWLWIPIDYFHIFFCHISSSRGFLCADGVCLQVSKYFCVALQSSLECYSSFFFEWITLYMVSNLTEVL